MPDISMCQNTMCNRRLKCYRYMAIPTPMWQSYGEFPEQDDKCKYFWAMPGTKQKTIGRKYGRPKNNRSGNVKSASRKRSAH